MDPSPSVESPGSEIRLYRASGAALVEVARLSAVAAPRAVAGALDAPEVDGDRAGGAGLFLALVQGESVVDVARLVFSGGEPSGDDGGPDCYSSNPSTSDDKAASSGSTKEEEVSSNYAAATFGALSLSGGGLIVGYEDKQWINPRNEWEEEGDGGDLSDERTEDDWSCDLEKDLSTKIPGAGQAGSTFWRSTNYDSSSDDEDWSCDLEKDLSTKIPVQAGSTFWRSTNYDSSSDEEDQDQGEKQEPDQDDEKEQISDDPKDLSIKKSVWRSANLDSSSDEQDQHQGQKQEVDQDDEKEKEQINDDPKDLNIKKSVWRSANLDSSSDEQDQHQGQKQEVDQDDEKENQSMQINIRLWPAHKHVVIKLFSGGKWTLTKNYALVWLNDQGMIESTLKVESGAPFANILGFRNTNCIMDFEINQLQDSSVFNDLMNLLKPSICDFQIIKRVGGHGDCKVFKCLFMGSKCALKSLTQNNPCTLEPREIEIISNLKDMHVMIFYQAWIEPWVYKGQPEQEYLFIHLEFCQSTINHALLYENRHWFPNKWFLFEEIVRTVGKLHEAHVVHRDLKPDNIFLNSELVVRVGDFGDACIGCDELGLYGGGTPKLGTQYYLAPELNTGGKVTEKVDIYSLGVIFFEIFAMFKTGNERLLILPTLTKQGPPNTWDGDRKLYEMMTSLEPNDRPSATELLDYIHQRHAVNAKVSGYIDECLNNYHVKEVEEVNVCCIDDCKSVNCTP